MRLTNIFFSGKFLIPMTDWSCFLKRPILALTLILSLGGSWDHGSHLVVDSPTKTFTLGKLKQLHSPPARTKKDHIHILMPCAFLININTKNNENKKRKGIHALHSSQFLSYTQPTSLDFFALYFILMHALIILPKEKMSHYIIKCQPSLPSSSTSLSLINEVFGS